ncbi:MAG: DPP IV N-terminal domain-containing protein [Gemmataceae bacterium]
MTRHTLVTLLALVPLVRGQGTADDYTRAANLPRLTRDKVFRDRVAPKWFDGNKRFWYRNDLAGKAREFVLVDADAGRRELAFDHAKLAEALAKASGEKVRATHLPFDEVTFFEGAKVVSFQAFGKRWRYDRVRNQFSDGKEEPTKEPAAAYQRPRPTREGGGPGSPDGRWAVSFEGANVRLRDRKSGKEVTLTTDGKEGDGYGGRVWWSPDSRRFVVMKTKAGQNRQVHMVESSPRDQLQPKLHTMTYAKPGDTLAVSKPHLFEAESAKEVEVPDGLFSTPWGIDRVRWEGDSSRFTFVYNQRGHQALRVVAVDAATGKASALVDERSKTFIDYAHKQYLHWLPAAGELVWMSERDGWNHLYLYDAKTGEVKNPITKGEWVVRGVDRLDEKARQVWFRCSGIRPGQDPYYVHFARVNLDGTGLTLLTEGDGTHEVRYSPDNRYLLDTYSRVDLPPVTELRRVEDGKLVCALERGDMTDLVKTGWKVPERFVAKGRDGTTDIHGVIWRPTNFDPNKKYPVIEHIYAGPQGSFVPKPFRPFHSPQGLAELGFVLVQMDGMGTSNRSKAFHDVCWKNLGDSGFPDRVLWIKAAAKKYPYLDVTRVGIYGGSAGGQSSTRALMAHGDFYKVAVSDCGCHDNRVDKVWWNELWMGYPVGPHYAEQSNATVENARKMTGKLLLTVGELDRNVDPASTMQVVNALVKANKDFDLLVIPGGGHGAGGSPYGQRRRQDFFVRHLLSVEPRRAAHP